MNYKSFTLLSFHLGLVMFTSLCSLWTILNKFIFWMVANGRIIFTSVVALKIVFLFSLLLLGYVTTSRQTIKLLYEKKTSWQISVVLLLLTATALVIIFFAGFVIEFYNSKLEIENLAVYNLENFENLRLNRLLLLMAPALFLLVLYYRLLPEPHPFQRINFSYLVNASRLFVFPVHGYLLFLIALIPGKIGESPVLGLMLMLAILFLGSYSVSAVLNKKPRLKMLLFWIAPYILSITSVLHPSLQISINPLLELSLLSTIAIASGLLGFRKSL